MSPCFFERFLLTRRPLAKLNLHGWRLRPALSGRKRRKGPQLETEMGDGNCRSLAEMALHFPSAFPLNVMKMHDAFRPGSGITWMALCAAAAVSARLVNWLECIRCNYFRIFKQLSCAGPGHLGHRCVTHQPFEGDKPEEQSGEQWKTVANRSGAKQLPLALLTSCPPQPKCK